MITCELTGGLGNNLFIVAAGQELALKTDDVLVLPEWKFSSNECVNTLMGKMNGYGDIFDKKINSNQGLVNLTIFKTIKENEKFKYSPIKHIGGNENIRLSGTFISANYFNKDMIMRFYAPSEKIKTYINNKYKNIINLNTTSVHVRRGDYLTKPDCHPVQDMNYYDKAFSILRNTTDKFIVFSDDIPWCKNNFIGDKFYFVCGEKNYIDLFFMTMCKNNIIANSTFSWWGAYLNKNTNQVVVAPKKWLGPSLSHYDYSEIYCDNWITI